MSFPGGSTRIPCRIIRGGTSKGVYFHERDLPLDPAARDRAILAAFGAAERRQIDGLGGADPLTSKVALLRPARNRGADVDYTCGQVGIGRLAIDYSLNCGNLAAGAALFAIDEGLVPPAGSRTTVRIFNPPTKSLCVASVTPDATTACRDGGNVATGVAVELRFPHAAGAATGALLPTGRCVDRVRLPDGRSIEVSIVDTGNVYAFVAAPELELRGTESPEEIERDRAAVALAGDVLRAASALVRERTVAPREVEVRRLALVSPSADATRTTDVTGRILTADGRGHKSFAVTGAIATAFAAFLRDSIVRRAMRRDPGSVVRIAHPEGAIDVDVECAIRSSALFPVAAVIHRTARCLLDGSVHVPAEAVECDAERAPEARAWASTEASW